MYWAFFPLPAVIVRDSPRKYIVMAAHLNARCNNQCSIAVGRFLSQCTIMRYSLSCSGGEARKEPIDLIVALSIFGSKSVKSRVANGKPSIGRWCIWPLISRLWN